MAEDTDAFVDDGTRADDEEIDQTEQNRRAIEAMADRLERGRTKFNSADGNHIRAVLEGRAR